MRALILAYKTKKHGKTGNCQGVTYKVKTGNVYHDCVAILVTTGNIKDFLSLDWRIMYNSANIR